MRGVLRALVPLTGLTLVMATLLAAGSPRADLVLRLYAFALALLAARALLRWLSVGAVAPGRTALDAVVAPSPPGALRRPDGLVAAEGAVGAATRTAYSAHHDLRPRVRRVVAQRLASTGIALDTDPRAPGLLGRDGWDLVRPDRPEPRELRGTGLTPDTLQSLLEMLERI